MRQVCVRRDARHKSTLSVADLAIVDMESALPRKNCGKRKIPQLWKPVNAVIRELLGQLGVQLDRNTENELLYSMSKENLEFNSNRILEDDDWRPTATRVPWGATQKASVNGTTTATGA